MTPMPDSVVTSSFSLAVGSPPRGPMQHHALHLMQQGMIKPAQADRPPMMQTQTAAAIEMPLAGNLALDVSPSSKHHGISYASFMGYPPLAICIAVDEYRQIAVEEGRSHVEL